MANSTSKATNKLFVSKLCESPQVALEFIGLDF
jgi:hypothetical protein